MKKRVFIALSLLLLSGAAMQAQRLGTENPNEFRIGIGIPLYYGSYYNYHYDPYYNASYRFIYTNRTTIVPSFSISYFYQFKSWLAFGGTFNYAGRYATVQNLYTGEQDGKNSENYFSITPTVRFDWLRTKYVKMYSSIGLGLNIEMDRSSSLMTNTNRRDCYFLPSYELTFVGLAVGRTVFGFAELGSSSNTLFRAGIGYRFNAKKGE